MKKISSYYPLTLEEAQMNNEVRNLIEEIERMDLEEFEKVKQALPKPTYLEPSTIGSYLFGDELAHYGDVHKNCSLFYLQSKGRRDEEKCQAQIFTLKNSHSGIERIENYPSTHGILYLLDDKPFEGLPFDIIRELSAKGVENLTLVETKQGRHKVLYERESLISIPTELDAREGFFIQHKEKEFRDETELRTFLPYILIVGFIILALYFFL